MSETIRSLFFWLHLGVGVAVGLVVAMMSLTGVALAFQPQVEAWARSGMEDVGAGAGPRLPVDEMLARAEASFGGKEATAITLPASERAAATVHFGRSDRVYVHPESGEVYADPGAGWAQVFVELRNWHRWFGASGENRPLGGAITGASNLLFVFLLLSGLYLWFPRKWTKKAFRAVLVFRWNLKGKARDWNWHHTLGFWTWPVLVVLTVTAVVISYPWANRMVYSLTGSPAPTTQRRPGPPPVELPPHEPGAQPLSLDAIAAAAFAQSESARSVRIDVTGRGADERGAVYVQVSEAGSFPAFAPLNLAFDPYDGALLLRRGFADQNAGQRLRWWIRFLHTGEALGWPGQLIAAVASLAGAVLVWTGFALAIRRALRWRERTAAQKRTGSRGLADPAHG